MSTSCGIAEHDDYCLCDVIAPADGISSTRWIDPITEGFYGPEIASHLGISRPYSNDDLIRFFEMQTALHDQLHAVSQIELPSKPHRFNSNNPAISKVPRTVLAEIALKVVNGEPSASIRKWVVDTHGITISASHMSHLRKRLIKKTVKENA